MTYLVDTDWVASWLNGRAEAIRLLEHLAPDGLAINLITYGEIYEGLLFAKDPQPAVRAFQQFLRIVRVLPLNRAIMQEFARIRGSLRSQGNLIPDADIVIAATAIYHDMELVTRNRKHFERISTLQIYKMS